MFFSLLTARLSRAVVTWTLLSCLISQYFEGPGLVAVKRRLEIQDSAFTRTFFFPLCHISLLLRSILTGEPGKGVLSLSLAFLLLLLLFVHFILCVSVLLAYMSMHHVHAWHPGKSEETGRFLQRGVTGVCELPCGCWESNGGL